jgi:DNA-binding transcriptional LysR family regulator
MLEWIMLNFTLKQLRYVEATGRLGSIAKAASELSISQSSITAAIDALEAEMGYDLFVRTPAKGIQATPAGSETLALVRGFMDQSRHFESEMKSVGGTTTGSVRIACYATAAPSFLPPILKSFTKSNPGISIKLLEGNMEATLAYLNNGEADLAFCYQEVVQTKQDFVPLFGAPPYALLPADDPMAHGDDISFEDLSKRQMVMLDLPRTREYFISMFDYHGLKANIVHSTRSAEITRALVAAGYGYSILNILPPDYRADDSRFRVLPIRDEIHIPIFGIVTQATTRHPRMVQSFIDQCVALAQEGAFDGIVLKR